MCTQSFSNVWLFPWWIQPLGSWDCLKIDFDYLLYLAGFFFFFFFFQMSLGPKGRGEVRNPPHLMRRESWSPTNCANLGLIAIFFFSTSNYLYSSVCPTVTLTRNNHRGLFTRSLWKKTLWSSPRRLCSKRRIIMDSQQTQNQPLSTRRLHNSISIKILSCPCSLTKLVNFR